MDEIQADAVADALGGDVWNSGGEMYLVILRRADGRVVAIGDDSVCVYATDDALQSEAPIQSIVLR